MRPDPASGLLRIGQNSEKWQWRHNFLTWGHHQFFRRCFVAVIILSMLVTCPSFVSISSLVLELWQFSLVRDWPEIRNTPVWVLPNIWRLGWVRDTKFSKDVSNKILLNAARFQGHSFYRFWVIKGKPIGGKITHPFSPLRLGLNDCLEEISINMFGRNKRGINVAKSQQI